jgi:ankyrin repeat protein
VTFLQVDDYFPFLDEQLARIGIVQRSSEGKPQFIHRTFAEYLVAEFLAKELQKKTKQLKQVQDILLNKVLLRTDCQVIRSFLDRFLEKIKPSNEALKEYGEKLNKQLQKREEHGPQEGVTTALHTAATENNASIIVFLLESLKSGGELSTVTEMLLVTDCRGRTALHKAAENDSVQALEKIWEWAGKATTWKAAAERGNLDALSDHSATSYTTLASVEEEKLQPNQLKNSLFVAKDQYGNTAWHGAAHSGSLRAFETLWSWAKEENLNQDELLLVQGKDGNTAWQLAAQTGHLKFLQKLQVWAKEVEVNPNDIKNKLLLAKDKNGCTVWHQAAESGNLKALHTLWFLVTVSELKPDEMLLYQDEEGNTAWQLATQKCHFEVLKKLWEWANGQQMGADVLKDKLLLAKDQYENTAWHRAAEIGDLETLETLWSWAKEVEIHTDELNKNLLLAQYKQGETAWHLAADRDHLEVLKKMWVWAIEAQKNPNDLIKEFLETKDKYGYTAWHRAAQRDRLKTLELLWGRPKEVDLNPDELKHNSILVKNEEE